jgi:hypothetical protein
MPQTLRGVDPDRLERSCGPRRDSIRFGTGAPGIERAARAAIERGLPLAQAAAHAGFADQSHMTRQFKRAYGLTPARWTVLTAG